VATSVAGDGYLGLVQGVGLQPVPPTHAGYPDEDLTADSSFGTGAFLLAGAAVHDIATTAGTTPVKRYQAETLATTVSPGDKQADIANRFASGGLANAASLGAVGDYVQFNAPNVPNGTYRLSVKFRLDPDNGIWQLKTNGVNTGTPTDGYDASGHYAEVEIGSVTYTGGPAAKQYRFVVAGKSALSAGFGVGIDAISLYSMVSGQTLQAFLLGGPGAIGPLADASGATLVAAPVPLPAPAGLLFCGLGFLGLLARSRRACGQPAAIRDRSAKRAFHSASSYSAAAVESATTPPPTFSTASPPGCSASVRMATLKDARPSGPAHPIAPQ
jgi:hypothetical protein